MCLILFACQQHNDYPLVILANRDEFYARPSLSAHFWKNHPQPLAGRDLQAGGTWMGITKTGRFAAVTNYRSGLAETGNKRTRGELPLRFLAATGSAHQFISDLDTSAEDYAGFNLLVGDAVSGQLAYYSNRGPGYSEITEGIHGLSNGFLDTPWPKVTEGKQALSDALQQPSMDPQRLFNVMQNAEPASDDQLPDTGIPLEKERLLSSRFIQSRDYGTRVTTLLLIDRSGQGQWLEQNYTSGGQHTDYRQISFQIDFPSAAE